MSQERNDRVGCANCGKEMVPRIIMRQSGRDARTICPFCGETFKQFTYFSDYVTGIVIVGLILFLVLRWIAGLLHS